MKHPLLLLALILSLLFATSCTPKTPAPPAEPPEISETPPPATTEPPQVESGEHPNDNPYHEYAGVTDYHAWAYSLFEYMRGAERWDTSAMEEVSRLELTLTDETYPFFHHSIVLPQIDQPWAEELNQYYRNFFQEIQDEWLLLFKEFFGGDREIPHSHLSITLNDIYEWDRFLVVALSYSNLSSRGYYYPKIDAFDMATGARLTGENVFADENWREQVLPILQTAYKEYGRGFWSQISFPRSEALFVTPSGIGFQYYYGELHDMASGAECLIIPYEILDGLLNPEIFG